MSMNCLSCIRLTSLGGTGGSPAPMYIGGSLWLTIILNYTLNTISKLCDMLQAATTGDLVKG